MTQLQNTINQQYHEQQTQFAIKLHWLQWFLKTHYKHFAIELSIATLILVVLQLLYPVSFSRPRTYIGNKNYGFQSRKSIISDLNKLNASTVKIELDNSKIDKRISDIGLQVNSELITSQALDYKWYERLIPFSILFSHQEEQLKLEKVNPARLNIFAKSIEGYSKNPKDAEIKLDQGLVNVVPAENGVAYSAEKIAEEFDDYSLNSSGNLKVPANVISPAISTTDAEEIANVIKQRLNTPLSLDLDGEIINISAKDLATWITVTKNEEGKLAVNYDKNKVKDTLASLKDKIYISQVANTITLLDGETIDSKNGKKGQMLDLENTASNIIKDSQDGKKLTKAVISEINAKTIYVRNYTKSNKGFQALISDWAKGRGGQFGISFISLDGAFSASYNGSSKFTSASIYKLYLADIIYNKVSNGQLSLTDPINGTTIQGCIEVMIVRSDNPCAIALGNLVGWSANNSYLQGKGFGSTSFVSGGHLTTANDTAKLLTMLNNGSLISPEYKGQLISYMNRNIYRSGIPAGSLGSVSNKVGFLGGLNHDAGIVNHPKGSYVLVIMSSGSNFNSIADLSRKISNLMNQ